MIQNILVAILFIAAVAWIGKRLYDQASRKKSGACEKCGQPQSARSE